MIVVRLSGGLGNQLFQYAIGRRLAILNSTDLIIEDSFYVNPPNGVTPRPYELDHYPIKARKVTPTERVELKTYTNVLMRLLRKYFRVPGRFIYIREGGDGFGKFSFDERHNIFLDGYWQSEKYFINIASELREELQPNEPMTQADLVVAKKINDSNSVCLHIRRGDYVSLTSASRYHGVCDLDYYQRAIKYLANQVENPHFFIFSDDHEWAQKNLNINYPCFFVDHNGAKSAFQDLRLMSLNMHHILANSTFSWWGAWLADRKIGGKRIVVAPKKWFAVEGHDHTDRFPEHWVLL